MRALHNYDPLQTGFHARIDAPGEFGHLLPEEQIQPACEEAYAGAMSIITYVHDKAFSGAPRLSGAAVTIWIAVVAACLTTAGSV